MTKDWINLPKKGTCRPLKGHSPQLHTSDNFYFHPPRGEVYTSRTGTGVSDDTSGLTVIVDSVVNNTYIINGSW